MSKLTCTLVKKSAAPKRASGGSQKAAAGDAAVIQDNEDGTFTVFGVDAGGNQVDISAAATITVTSDAPSICSVDPPTGVTDKYHGLVPGTANLSITTTFNDGSVGPFNMNLVATVKPGPVTGTVVVLGPVTPR